MPLKYMPWVATVSTSSPHGGEKFGPKHCCSVLVEPDPSSKGLRTYDTPQSPPRVLPWTKPIVHSDPSMCPSSLSSNITFLSVGASVQLGVAEKMAPQCPVLSPCALADAG